MNNKKQIVSNYSKLQQLVYIENKDNEKKKQNKIIKNLEHIQNYSNFNYINNTQIINIYFKFIKNNKMFCHIFYSNDQRINFIRNFPLYKIIPLKPILFNVINCEIAKIIGYFYGENDIKTFIVETFIKIFDNKYNSNILITEKTLLRKLKKKFIISDYITNEQILKINFDN